MPDEGTVFQVDGKRQTGLVRIEFFAQFVSVQWHPSFQAKRVTGPQSSRFCMRCIDGGLPEERRVRGADDQFAAVFAGVTGPAHNGFTISHSFHAAAVVSQRRQIHRATWRKSLNDIRSLHRDHRCLLGAIFPAHVFFGMLVIPQPPGDFFAIARIDNHDMKRRIVAVPQMIHEDVVQDATVVATNQTVADLARLEIDNTPCDHAIEEPTGIRPEEVKPPHVRHVKDASRSPCGVVLTDNRPVLNRHGPTREIHEPGSQALVQIMEGRFLKCYGTHVWQYLERQLCGLSRAMYPERTQRGPRTNRLPWVVRVAIATPASIIDRYAEMSMNRRTTIPRRRRRTCG